MPDERPTFKELYTKLKTISKNCQVILPKSGNLESQNCAQPHDHNVCEPKAMRSQSLPSNSKHDEIALDSSSQRASIASIRSVELSMMKKSRCRNGLDHYSDENKSLIKHDEQQNKIAYLQQNQRVFVTSPESFVKLRPFKKW